MGRSTGPKVRRAPALVSARVWLEQLGAGHSLPDIAREAGVSYTALRMYASGKTELSVDNAKMLAAYSRRIAKRGDRVISAALTLGVED
jgi:AcrR family transcriptional regulator